MPNNTNLQTSVEDDPEDHQISRKIFARNHHHHHTNSNKRHSNNNSERSHSLPPTFEGRSKLAASFPSPSSHPSSSHYEREPSPRTRQRQEQQQQQQQKPQRGNSRSVQNHRRLEEDDDDEPQHKPRHQPPPPPHSAHHRMQLQQQQQHNNDYEDKDVFPSPPQSSHGSRPQQPSYEDRRSGSSSSVKSNRSERERDRDRSSSSFRRNEPFYEPPLLPPPLNLEVERCPSDTNNEFSNSNNGKATKKVSYAPESKGHQLNFSGGYQLNAPIPCRLRAGFIETDESDINCSFDSRPNPRYLQEVPPIPPPNRVQYDPFNPEPLLVTSVDSQGSFLGLSQQQPQQQQQRQLLLQNDNNYYLKKSPNNNGGGSSICLSQDSMLSLAGNGRGPPPLPPQRPIYAKDVLPLPIEIPENVANIEAFRHYLSVRRGAIKNSKVSSSSSSPFQSFEKGNQRSPSYESLGGGRRAGGGRASLGLTPSRAQLGHEVSRRTASLSHAIMTLALLSASICQLRFLVTYSYAHSYPVLNYFLIFTSIILEVFIFLIVLSQIAAGIGYVMISRCNYDDDRTEAIHNYLIFALFIVAVANVILAAFAFDGHICDSNSKRLGGAGESSSGISGGSSSSNTRGQFGQQQQNQINQATMSISRTGVGDTKYNRESNYNAIE